MYNSERARANREYYLSRGLCPKCNGRRRLAPGRRSCEVCAKENREIKRRTHERRIAEGLCTQCGKPLDDRAHKTCEACRQRNYAKRSDLDREANKARYEAYLEKGICPGCGQRWAEPGHTYCAGCLAKNRRSQKKNPENAEKKRQMVRRRRENGLCVDCGRPAIPGRQCCARCRDSRRDSVRKYRIHRRTVLSGLQWE